MRAVQAELDKTSAAAETLRGERDRLIRQALKEGWTHADIARAAGMTRGRVGQIAMRNH
jgi:hypothetical protein